MRRQLIAAVGFVAIVASGCISGCATMGSGSGEVQSVNVEVKNNLTLPTDLSLYAVSSGGRQLIGTIGPGDTKTLRWTPRSNTETYRLVAERQLARPIRSQPFTIGSEMTGTIGWTLVPNILSFYGPDEVDTVRVK